MGNWFNIAVGICPQFRTEQSKDLSRYLKQLQLLQELGLIQLHGRGNANVYQNLLKHVMPSLRTSTNQPAVFTGTILPVKLHNR